MLMARISWPGICSVDLPNRWQFAEADGVLNFFREDGVGALQISFLRRNRVAAPTLKEAQILTIDFAKQRNREIVDNEVHTLSVGGGPASEIEFFGSSSGEYWHVWHLVGQHFAAFVSYTSGAEDRDRERAETTAIVHSFQWDVEHDL
jgi:hypothetical protein